MFTVNSFNSTFRDSSLAPIIATPIIIYSNLETDKTIILSNNKGKAGIYQWTHKESGKIYVGSAYDLYNRFRQYYSKGYLRRYKNIFIMLYFYTVILHLIYQFLSK
jgi:hypothetical protein